MPVKLGFVSLAGVASFALLFVGGSTPTYTASLAIVLGATAALIGVEIGTRNIDTRQLALLAALAAIDAGLRLALVNGIAGFSPIFFLILCAGYVFGPSYGFLVGSLSLLVSALVTGGVGPWLPYEMLGCGWVGALAGTIGLGRQGLPDLVDLVLLAIAGFVLGFAYGAAVDIFDWTTYYRGDPDLGWTAGMAPLTALRNFTRFYIVTSAAWDSFRAVGNAVMVLALGAPVIAALRRYRARFTLVIEPA
jgi:energy-coupling factor transport system substrate-specific component